MSKQRHDAGWQKAQKRSTVQPRRKDFESLAQRLVARGLAHPLILHRFTNAHRENHR